MDNQSIETVQQDQSAPERIEVVMPIRKSKPIFELEKKDTIFATFAIVLSVFLSVFGIFGGFALGYSITTILLIIILITYFIKKSNVQIFSLLCCLLTFGNAVVFITTTNVSVRFFAAILILLLALVCFNGLVNHNIIGNRETMGVFYSAISSIGNIGVSLKSLFSNGDSGKKTMGKVMLGLLCAIPVLIIVVPLLIKSDDAFSGMMTSIFSNSGNTFLTVLKAVFGAIISMFVISYGFSLKYNRLSKPRESKFTGIENAYIISFLSAIATCYLLYLFSQLAYFFSAFKGFLPNEDITYSQYARKGFFEMCIIAVINLGVVFLSILLAKKQNGKVCVGIKVISTFVSAFTLIIIATAISKMVLYINEFGMTVLRVTTSAFMLFLSVVFIAVILRIFINKINIVKTALITAGIVVLLLGTVNVNALCAHYNYESYKEGRLKIIDIDTLYNLGDEGIPYVVKLACCDDRDVALEAQSYLKKAYRYDYFDNTHSITEFTVENFKKNQKYNGFERFSIPKKRAYDDLYKFIEKNPEFHVLNYSYH